jgi:hypothetical protein
LELVLIEACHRLWWKIPDPLGVEPSHCLWIKVADLLGIKSTERGGVEGLDVTGLELAELIWIDLPDGASTARWWTWADRTGLTTLSALVLSALVLSALVLSALVVWRWSRWGWICVAWFVVRLRRLRRKWRGSWRERERKKE